MRKFALVDPEELQRWKMAAEKPQNQQEFHTVNPRLNAMARLDTLMEKTLDSKVNEEEKARMYSQTLQEFLDLKDQGHLSVAEQFKEVKYKRELPVSDIASTVPKQFRTKAEQLAEWIKHSGTMSWDETGRLIVDGKVMENTNIIDLINDALRKRKKFAPHGRDIFVENLRKRNAPRELVGNEAYWEEEEERFSPPPPHFHPEPTPSTSSVGKIKHMHNRRKMPYSEGKTRKKPSEENWSGDINL